MRLIIFLNIPTFNYHGKKYHQLYYTRTYIFIYNRLLVHIVQKIIRSYTYVKVAVSCTLQTAVRNLCSHVAVCHLRHECVFFACRISNSGLGTEGGHYSQFLWLHTARPCRAVPCRAVPCRGKDWRSRCPRYGVPAMIVPHPALISSVSSPATAVIGKMNGPLA